MLFTKDKPLDEVLESLGAEKNIFLDGGSAKDIVL